MLYYLKCKSVSGMCKFVGLPLCRSVEPVVRIDDWPNTIKLYVTLFEK